jgi:hypothetical protein
LFSLFKEDLCNAFYFSGLEFSLGSTCTLLHFLIFGEGRTTPFSIPILFHSAQVGTLWDTTSSFPFVLGFGYL